MSGPVSNCPNCGGPIQFRWAGAVQTTCPYCHSILVRHDLELEKVGTVSDLPATTSPIQIGTEGRYRSRAFTVVGRIVYEYERGTWSEWHLAMDDGSSGWLSDALDEYAVSFQAPTPDGLPPEDQLRPGMKLLRGGVTYEVTTLTRARYRGVEGELPFELWDRETAAFADLRDGGGRFATLDYSGDPPLLYLGEFVEFASLGLTHLRGEDETATRVEGTRGLNCPNCGDAVSLRDPERAVNVVCPSCGAILDATSPTLRLLQKAKQRNRIQPQIPLGSTGRIKGEEYAVLGYQMRTITVEGTDYSWREYLLRSPRQGYRYLTEYDGHWNDVVVLKSLPKEDRDGGHLVARVNGTTFKHFQSASARTTYVLGEFPWQVRMGDQVLTRDFVAPPLLLSSETTGDETTWSLGEYTPPARIWEMFSLPGSPPSPRGVFANQPAPGTVARNRLWKTFGLLFVLLLGLVLWRMSVGGGRTVFQGSFEYNPANPAGAALATDTFRLDGRTSAVGIELDTDVSNSWGYFSIALVNDSTRTAYEVGREVSYYFGVDGGESWSEGSAHDEVRIPSVPPGRYFLLVTPEGPVPVLYRIVVLRDPANMLLYFLTLLLLLVPPVFASLRSGTFEVQRWAESDYAPNSDD
jgi:hypothetical protein